MYELVMLRRKVLVRTAALLLLVLLVVPFANVLAAPGKGPVTNEIYFKEYIDDQAAMLAVRKGEIDWHYWRIPYELVEDLKKDPNIKIYFNPLSGIHDLYFNPAPNAGGHFNPFALREFRFGLQYLVDREAYVNEQLKGQGIPMVAPIVPVQYDYGVIGDVVDQLGIRYDETKGRALMAKALLDAGAVKKGGKWYYNGEPIKVKVIIRVEDERKLLGDFFANTLEDFGIEVDRVYANFDFAIPTVYLTDPMDGKWHVYTEGWGFGTFSKYNEGDIAFFYSPKWGYFPGLGNPAWWNYQNATADKLGDKLALGKFISKYDRDEAMRKLTLIGLEESIRVFVATTAESYAARKDVKDIVCGPGSGMITRFNYMSAYKPGSDVLYVGAKYMPRTAMSAYTRYLGPTGFYSDAVWNAITDPGAVTRHPFTGEIYPWRATFTVSYDYDPATGPKEMTVPSDAFVWDSKANQWKEVGNGVKAKAKVVANYVLGKWHDGADVTLADVLYLYYWLWEWTSDDSTPGNPDPYYDSTIASYLGDSIRLIKGIKVINSTAIEVYVDYWHFDDKEIAATALYWPDFPMHLSIALEQLVAEGKYAFSEAVSSYKGVDQLDPLSKNIAMDIKAKLQELKQKGYVPTEILKIPGYKISADVVLSDYDKAIQFIDKHGHAVISNGPYILDKFDPTNRFIHLVANRDYPFTPEKWADFKYAKMAQIAGIMVEPIIDKAQGSVIKIRVLVGGEPSNEAEVHYKIVSRGLLTSGRVLAKGVAQPSSTPGIFVVNLTPGMMAAWISGPAEIQVRAASKYSSAWAYAKASFFITGQSSLDLSAAETIGGTPVIGSENDRAAANILRDAFGLNDAVLVKSLSDQPEGDLFIIGGPEVNILAATYNKPLGIEIKTYPTITISVNGKSLSIKRSDYGKADIAVIAIGEVSGRKVVLVEGGTRYGTEAAALFLAKNVAQLTGSTWAIIQWADQNGDGKIQLDEIAVKYSG